MKFTKEQRKNIIRTKTGWTNIHTHVETDWTRRGFETEMVKDENGNEILCRKDHKSTGWGSDAFTIPVEEEKSVRYLKYNNYFQIKVKGDVISFHTARRRTEYVHKLKMYISNNGRNRETWLWNTKTDNVIHIQTRTRSNGTEKNVTIKNCSLLAALADINATFENHMTEDAWKKVLEIAGMKGEIEKTYYGFRIDINQDFVKEIFKRWNQNSNIQIPEKVFTDMTIDREGYIKTIQYGAFNTIRRIKNPEAYIRRITKGYGKKIRKALYAEPYKAQFFNWVRKYEDNLDTLQKYVASDKWITFYQFKYKLFDTIKEHKDQDRRIIKWFLNSNEESDWRIRRINDIFNMIQSIDNWNEKYPNRKFEYKLYDDAAKTESEITTMYNRVLEAPIEFAKYSIKYQNKSEWDMKLPTDSAELKTWGQMFHNCVATYKNKILDGRAEIVTMWNGNNPEVCIEVDPKAKEVVQAFKICNERLNDEEYNILKAWGTLNGLTMNLCSHPR